MEKKNFKKRKALTYKGSEDKNADKDKKATFFAITMARVDILQIDTPHSRCSKQKKGEKYAKQEAYVRRKGSVQRL